MFENVPMIVWLGLGGAAGAAVRGLIGYANAKSKNKKTTFEWMNFTDSIWQGLAVGCAAGLVGITMAVQAIVVGFLGGWTGSSVGDKTKLNVLSYLTKNM